MASTHTSLELKDIISNEFQQDIVRSLTVSTGIGVAFIDRQGRHVGPNDNFCRFCHEINSTAEGCAACEASNRVAARAALEDGKSHIYLCHAGLVSFVIPLIYDGEYLGALTGGQVRCENAEEYPVYQEFSFLPLKDRKLQEYYEQTEYFSNQQIESTLYAFQCISDYIVQQIAYNKMKQDLMDAQTRQLQLENQLKAAKLSILQKQIMPHFLFNVLGGIARLIDTKQIGDARKMLIAYTKMMRYSLSEAGGSVTLERELGYIRNYLEIQGIRFGQRLKYSIDCPAEFLAMRVPVFSIQPLVENALEHGILPRPSGGRIYLKCVGGEDGVVLSMEDDGSGISSDQLDRIRNSVKRDAVQQGDDVGLYNSSQRFYHMYGDRVCYSIESKPGYGTRIRIYITEPEY